MNIIKSSSLLLRATILIAVLIVSVLVLFTITQIVVTQLDLTGRNQIMITQLSQVIAMIAATIIYLNIMGDDRNTTFQLRSPNNGLTLLLAALFAICALPLINYFNSLTENSTILNWFNNSIRDYILSKHNKSEALTLQLLTTHSYWGLAVNFIVVALGAAFSEEMLFRGVIMNGLAKHLSYHHAIWLTAIIFSACHFEFIGFIPRALLGAAFGYIVVYSGSLWSSIIAHTINNAAVILFTFMSTNSTIPISKIEHIGTGHTTWLCIISIVIIITIFWLMKRIYQERTIIKHQ